MRGMGRGGIFGAVALALAVGTGCITTTSLTSPDVLPVGQSAFCIGFTNVAAVGMGSMAMSFRHGIMERVDIGGGLDMFTIKMDVRYQWLLSERHLLDSDVEFGVGMMAVIIPTYYVGVGVGFNLGPALAPYVRYRHTFLGVKDTGDADEDGDFNLNEINGWGQAIVGCEIRMNKVAIIPEVSWVQDLESDTGEQLQTFSLGIRFASF